MPQTSRYSKLYKKITDKTAVVAVVGLGYVGSALAAPIIKKGFSCRGFDIDTHKVAAFNTQKTKRVYATTNQQELADCDVIIICVPTPVDSKNQPDLGAIVAVVRSIVKNGRPGQLICLESSVAPGTTRQLYTQYLTQTGFQLGKDLFVAFSPERIDPGNEAYTVVNTPKVVAGLDELSKKLAVHLYTQFVDTVVSASSVEAAELAKMFENSFRLVNISLVHELQHYTEKLGLSIREIIDMAATKPYGFLPHYPGPGVGGHCIPVDPYYILHDAKKHKVELPIIEQALITNEKRPAVIVEKALELLKKSARKKHTVLLIGVTYKRNIADTRESAATKIAQLLQQNNVEVRFYDPYVENHAVMKRQELTPEVLKQSNLIIIVTNHAGIDYDLIQKHAPLILDTRRVYNGHSAHNVVLL